jgi:hypothetical protein
MNGDWRSRNTMTGREALKAAAAILGLLFACILAGWVVTRLMRPPADPAPVETRQQPSSPGRN